MPVELIGVPPVWVDQALELEAGTDVDGMWIDGMEEVVEGAGYVMCLSLDSQLLMQHVILLSESRQLCLILSLELSL